MPPAEKPIDEILGALQERAKELNCLYRVDEILNRHDVSLDVMLHDLIEAIPPGWQYPEVCQAVLSLEGEVHRPDEFAETPWKMTAPVVVEGQPLGELSVYYRERRPPADEGPFLKEERRLINAIAERVGYFLMQRKLRATRQSWKTAVGTAAAPEATRWSIILDFLQRTDQSLLVRITRKMINHLCWNGVGEAEGLLQQFSAGAPAETPWLDENRPLEKKHLHNLLTLTEKAFQLASRNCGEDEVISCVQTWIREEKSSFMLDTLENLDRGVPAIADAIDRFHGLAVDESQLPVPMQTGLRVALLRRVFSDQLAFINTARSYVRIEDFYPLFRHMVVPAGSHGKLGGKSAGLFVANRMIQASTEHAELLGHIKVPKTWYVVSDALLHFIRYNNMEDLYNWKYQEIDRIRQEYPHIVQVFKNSPFPPEIEKGLAIALDDFEGRPIIVRSSSLLEDRTGTAFSGKYKSLFLANQGSRKERLEALLDAIAEVYASVFSPDPIEYRAERGLLDVHEEMGIMIQEVVGKQIGKYFFPAFAGVAFSRNEFRWSARIKREDGLVRIVAGLGTRAVDRLGDDYPVLIAPGQPGLKVNVTPDEVVRYSPKMADVINLETNDFETVELATLLPEIGSEIPQISQLVSEVDGDHIRQPVGLGPDFEARDYVVTFDGLVADTPFVSQMRTLLSVLEEKLEAPVDIEFASDGEDLYLLQCRAQSYSKESAPASIPRNLPPDQVLFSANRYVSNGRVPDITHIVYVDPEEYGNLRDLDAMRDVGRAVGRLNKVLPKRQFILMGPGRWGSRGDIKLGVSVTYGDINNTAALVEIARKKGRYVPDLSFGTHFFQDLVEEGIRYLPLYPDEPGIAFNELFYRRSRNILADLLPRFEHLSDAVRVIDVPRETDGKILRVLLNADLDEAVGVLGEPSVVVPALVGEDATFEPPPEAHWRWRLRMAQKIAEELDPQRFGVKAFYVFGSTKNATAGPASDIDLLVHLGGDERQRQELKTWLEGWSLCLAEVNYLRTGYRSEGLLDVHLVTDEDIEKRASFAAKINAVTDPARPLRLKEA